MPKGIVWPMNLKSIKLSGFKSFVDPTLIPITAQITGIVGPNGCGKSNVVDAIRWVIGESSAKQLRGQSMTDVIFNGSTQRKPVGMASVELVFDNSDGRISGEFAKFSEISVRREVQREGQSQYYLNGANCRRRDIIDVFLGTGLGPRSYSIIEQGMISELIEAKPEDLRSHLEEVSGISKYKERRKETESRMRQTQENLTRLNDVNEELSKQLRHLKRQAEAAEKYTELKEQERKLQAEIKVLQWQSLARQIEHLNEPLSKSALIQEQHLAELSGLETLLEKIRAENVENTTQRDEIQKQFYEIGAEVARLEQRIQHRQEQVLQWRKELHEAETIWHELEEHAEEQLQNIEEMSLELSELTPRAQEAKSDAQAANQQLLNAEQAMRQWQRNWDSFQNETAQFTTRQSVLKNNLQHYEQQLNSLNLRRIQLQDRQQQIPLETLAAEIEPLNMETAQLQSTLAALQVDLERMAEEIKDQRQQGIQIKNNCDQQQQNLQKLQSRHASLEALQQTALGYHDDHHQEWIKNNALTHSLRLGQVLEVDSGWELAVETVLGGYFDAVCIEDMDGLMNALSQIQQGRLTLIDLNSEPEAQNQERLSEPLSSKVRSKWPLREWLSGVYVADDLAAAWPIRHQLAGGESIITRDGIWIGKNWVRVNKAANQDQGVLIREQELKKIEQEIDDHKEQLNSLRNLLAQNEQSLRQLEEQRDRQLREYQQTSTQLTKTQAQLSAKQSRLTELQNQQQRLTRELSESDQSLANLQSLFTKVQEQLNEANRLQLEYQEQRQNLMQDRDRLQIELDQVRQRTHQQRQIADELAVRVASTENQLAILKQNQMRDSRQRQQLNERRTALTAQIEETVDPIEQLRLELQQQLSSRLNFEQLLKEVEEQLKASQQQLNQLVKNQQNFQQKYHEEKNVWQKLQLDQQALLIRQSAIQEQLAEHHQTIPDLLPGIDPNAEIGQWEQRLQEIISRIQRLGAINLAAIEEYQVVNERKTYLDKQQSDLTEALDLLTEAINKIDRETKQKFQETFAQVNQNFQELFPRIFGGGKAELELLEQDWLNSGIQVKAQPPGKRNSTIHMLSGGEKALTAVALIFSMFKLNPAPFCVLDEVDAPLDEMNTGRFCQLVKEMARSTQFVMISHNKVTISLSERLMGVTMQEAGVSRIVSVNVTEAVALAEN